MDAIEALVGAGLIDPAVVEAAHEAAVAATGQPAGGDGGR
jgi:hypothetical protein